MTKEDANFINGHGLYFFPAIDFHNELANIWLVSVLSAQQYISWKYLPVTDNCCGYVNIKNDMQRYIIKFMKSGF